MERGRLRRAPGAAATIKQFARKGDEAEVSRMGRRSEGGWDRGACGHREWASRGTVGPADARGRGGVGGGAG
jgi:hypothetical protein